MVASACLTEEGVEGVIIPHPLDVVTRHLDIGLDAVFGAVESQKALQIWIPAWPMWMEKHSRRAAG